MNSAKGMIVGLGNPGKKYTHTRHNAGTLLLTSLLTYFDLKLKKEFGALAEAAETLWEPPPSLKKEKEETLQTQKIQLFLLRPQSYMNLSGKPVQKALQSYQIKAQEILVLHDETELPFGEIRFKQGGGHGGHNGLRDIIALIGADFGRLRFGVGRPEHKTDLADYLLSNFFEAEQEEFPSLFARAQEMCLAWLAGANSGL